MGNRTLDTNNTVYNLTFDEVESQLGNTGKSHHSMNFDELLKNVISAEYVQNPSANSSFLLGNTSSSGFNGALLSSSSSNKTINEVWMEINNQKNVTGSSNTNLQQSILGETSLEDFLAHAAAINMGHNNNNNHDNVGGIGDAAIQPSIGINPMQLNSSHQEEWLPLQMQMQMPMVCPDYKSVYENQVMGIGYSENSMAMPMVATAIASSSDSKGVGGVGRKQRFSDEMLEKTIERKQKRMAKNRESAARSRAKKQEHMNKLERDKIRLEKTNRWLKKLKVHTQQTISKGKICCVFELS